MKPLVLIYIQIYMYLTSSGVSSQNVNNKDNGVGLFPSVFNLAARASITVNATCGESEPEVYCKLVEHVQMRAPQCGVCDANAPDHDKRHPITHSIDGTNRWWQSPSLQNGPQFEWITITLDLKQVYQVAYVIVKSAISPRPANWILERSTDGSVYRPWQYYAHSDGECMARYGIQATLGIPSYKTDTDVICTSYYSKLNPLEGGEIHTSLVNGRPGANDSSAALRDFTLTRYVRLRLQKVRTLNAEFMSLRPGVDDASVTRRLFYSIKDISIGGQCVCSGHASQCPQNGKYGRPQCECQHNTCGSNCEQCCPLYNQFPWRVGTPSDGAQCEPCQCYGHATSCRYDPDIATARLSRDVYGEFRGGGVCINCTAHTTGINCERCEDGWYRPKGISLLDPAPCRPCNCNNAGTTGRCVQDGDTTNKTPGHCECLEGFGGPQCETCASGYRGYPKCELCSCDIRGIDLTSGCETDCKCKEYVEGEKCDRCKTGFFALDKNNPVGCMKCYCSGVSNICHASTDLHIETYATLSGWLVSDLAVSRTVLPSPDADTGQLTIGNYELPAVESYFWLAPERYRGNLLTSYGGNVSFTVSWVAMRGDTSGRPTVGPNMILVGSNGMQLGTGDALFKPPNATITITFVEELWYHVPSELKDIVGQEYHGEPASRAQLMSVLTHVKHMLLRAKFHTDQVEGSLWEASLQTTKGGGSGSLTHLIEHCECPPGYIGLSCEACGYGYTHVGLSPGQGECRKCNCSGHAATCDPNTGQCAPCEHNTNGTKCEICNPGYYGDATRGAPLDCQRCACPRLEASNNFSPHCEQDDNNVGYICTDCPQGYDGDHCEKCSSGFYGLPLDLGSTCKRCECGGGPCDERTGQCLRCRGNTEGWRCERCLPNHYGDPTQADCKPCECNTSGAEQTDWCDVETGQCKCRERYAGRTCEQCEAGYGNVTAGCVMCSCSSIGAVSQECDSVTGECQCHPGAGGSNCDKCEDLHFGFSSSGCQRCGCHLAGSEGPACDIITGQCPCRTHVTGRTCDSCQDGYWGLNNSRGCAPCECDRVGSVRSTCDPRTGQCQCRPGVGGLKCDECRPGYFGFSAAGCSECEHCDRPGHICDPDTGRCVCPPLTTGATCEHCQPGSWGFEPGKGCKACGCGSYGSVKLQCDGHTGRCMCREGYQGERCTICSPGYFGYPRCQRCDCSLAGTLEKSCDASKGYCLCDEAGQCPCKSNVIGKKCNHCKPGTFGLQLDNPDGCTQCFCFGRTTECTQAGLTVSQIMMAPAVRTLIVEYDSNTPQFRPGANIYPVNVQQICYVNLAMPGTGEVSLGGPDGQLNITNNLRVIPGDAGDVRLGVTYPFDSPVYWQLPKQFLGDRVLSYGGYIRFKVETEGGHTLLPASVLTTYPLIQLQGNGRIILEHYPLIPSPSGHYHVRFHESLWRLKSPRIPGTGDKVTREMLMVALQNMQHILIRASDSVDFTRATLRDVTLDTGILAPGRPPPLARGVELCDCPPQYNSSSCQDPSIGFYRWYDNSSISSTIVIQLVGEARPCQCNQRSRVCDIETGHCLNCAENTGGPHCERCGEGYYGDPARGPCRPCPCPTVERNFARSCRVSPKGHVSCHCREGYTGKRCDRCSYGWFGFPQLEGGSCRPCKCNPHGSVSDECHEQTGQCNCRPGITSRDCSQCNRDRFILTQYGCTSCDDRCTGVLLDDLAELARWLQEGAGHLGEGLVPPPWPELIATNNTALELEKWLNVAQRVAMLPEDLTDTLKWQAQRLQDRARRLENRGIQSAHDGLAIREKAENFSKELSGWRQEINDIINHLKNYGQAGPTGIVTVGHALREARRLLRDIKNRNLHPRSKAANHVLKICTDLLNRIKTMLQGVPELEDVRRRLNDFNNKLNDMNGIISKTVEKRSKASDINLKNEEGVRSVRGKLKRIESLESEQRALYAEGENFNKESHQLLNLSHDNLQNFHLLKRNLTELTSALEKREGILERLNPLYKEKYVLKAQQHADMLYNRSQQYRDLFNATERDAGIAVRASKAYQEIVDALEASKQAAVNASIVADIAYKKAHPGSGEDSLVDQAGMKLANSTRLLARARGSVDRVEQLNKTLKEEEKRVKDVQETVTKAAQANNDISLQLSKFNNKQGRSATQAVLEKTQMISDSLDKVLKRTDEISSDINNNLRPELEKLNSDFQVNAIINHVTASRENVQKSEDLLSRISEEAVEKNRKFQKWNDTMAARLQDLRNKITQARHAANGIQLSITSRANLSEGCIRSFHASHLEPSTTTSLILDYALDTGAKHRDALILYLPSRNSDDFIAVEMVARHIRFVWDVGGGAGQVEHPLKLEPGKSKEERNWYRIQIDRTSNIAKLAVRPHILPEGSHLESGTPVRNATQPGFGRLDVGPGDMIWIGGLPPSTPGPPLLKAKSKGLAGCLHKVILDGHVIGLWNFASQSAAGCAACIQSGEQTRDELTFRFNGEGYAVLYRPSSGPYNKYVFSVSLKFRTLDENALLFLAVNPNVTDRYVSLILRNGHVYFRVGYGADSRLEMSSLDKHNTGNWTIVEASRLFDRRKKLEKGVLKVEGEARDGAPTPPPGQDSLPDLSDALFFIGGIPPGSLGTSRLDLPGSFLGCMSDIQVMQDGYSPLRGQFYGVEAGCEDSALDKASFRGRGHLQLPSHTLERRNASFGFVFRTLQPNALLMLTAFRDADPKQGYYSVSLVDGQIEVRVDAGLGAAVVSPKGHYNDGKFHSLAVTKAGRRLELRVDDELLGSASLPKRAVVVRAQGASGGLYFGGVPPTFPNITPSALAASSVPLIGTIKDAIFNDQLLQFDYPISFEHVGIGRLDPISITGGDPSGSPSPSILPQPREGNGGNGAPQECRKGPSYSLEPGAAKFGDSPHSHVQIRQRASVLHAGDFTIEMDFRTLYPNGLLFIIPGGKGKQLHYILLQLRNKRLHLLVVKGKPKVDLEESQDLNDGVWHRVVLSREANRIMMMVDSVKPRRKKRYPKKLNIGNTMYVGGIPESGLLLPESLLVKLEGFKGCLRGLAINQQSQNLSGHKVGQCFPMVEQGSYFPGDAYAIYKEKFHVGALLELQLEFRTSENTGVLLSVSEPEGYPALSLELNDGKVIMSGDMGDRHPFRVEQVFPSPYTVCDNKWHRVKAFFVNDVLNLRVDNLAAVYGHSGNGQLSEASTMSPLYIGGLPEGAPSGTLGTRDNFKGCIRNVVIGGELKDWTDMASLNNILLSSCPVNS